MTQTQLMKKFSIIIPTFNRGSFILGAVNAILQQDYENFEIIIKDGGTNPVFNLLPQDPRIIYVWGKDRGITDAMNQGMRLATGDIFSWANDDDRMAEGTLSFVAENMLDNKWGYGRILMKSEKDSLVWGEPWNFQQLKEGNFVPQPSVYWTREALNEVGYMSEEEDLTSDYEFWLRLGSKFTPIFWDRIMAYYTIHPNQITQSRQREQLLQAKRTAAKYK